MAERLLGYRVFADDAGRMNRSLADTGGGLLLVSQFTLAADTPIGHAPELHAPPRRRTWLNASSTGWCESAAKSTRRRVETGRFGAHMTVSLVNDGPVTFLLRAVRPVRRASSITAGPGDRAGAV